MKAMKKATLIFLVIAFAAALSAQVMKEESKAPVAKQGASLPELQKMTSRFAPIQLQVDVSGLSDGDRKAIAKLIEASRLVDDIQLEQRWKGNEALYTQLSKEQSALGKARLHYFWINKGPWSILDENKAFIPSVPERKPLGANFYPEDATKEELEAWMKSLPEDQRKDAESFFTVIRRDTAGKFKIVPYSTEYAPRLAKMASSLREAAALTSNESLKKFLTLRVAAFTSNDYFDSDVAWMDLDSPVDVTIGPYETYNDELFGYKAAFEAYVNVRDEKESQK
ncbi:MAG: mismatch repair protein MutT, partial [Acidobacteriaceae bacterium]|nr:mismatch repair protein MutT [Acidobacteriaceae bacterium]